MNRFLFILGEAVYLDLPLSFSLRVYSTLLLLFLSVLTLSMFSEADNFDFPLMLCCLCSNEGFLDPSWSWEVRLGQGRDSLAFCIQIFKDEQIILLGCYCLIELVLF